MARIDAQASIKYILGWAAVFFVRLLPWRPPNVEPVLATLMPFAKEFGPGGAFLFGAASIALFDVAVGQVGQWTLITSLAYGTVGIGGWYYLRNRTPGIRAWTAYGIIGTLAYDALTGLTTGPLMFGQSLRDAVVGQIPFTLMHLAGTVALSLTLTPAIHRWVTTNERLQWAAVKSLLVPAAH